MTIARDFGFPANIFCLTPFLYNSGLLLCVCVCVWRARCRLEDLLMKEKWTADAYVDRYFALINKMMVDVKKKQMNA